MLLEFYKRNFSARMNSEGVMNACRDRQFTQTIFLSFCPVVFPVEKECDAFLTTVRLWNSHLFAARAWIQLNSWNFTHWFQWTNRRVRNTYFLLSLKRIKMKLGINTASLRWIPHRHTYHILRHQRETKERRTAKKKKIRITRKLLPKRHIR